MRNGDDAKRFTVRQIEKFLVRFDQPGEKFDLLLFEQLEIRLLGKFTFFTQQFEDFPISGLGIEPDFIQLPQRISS